MKSRTLRSIIVTTTVAIPLVAACGGKNQPVQTAQTMPTAPKPVDPPKAPQPVLERVVPHTCVGRAKVAQLLSKQSHAAPSADPVVSESSDAQDAPPPKTATSGKSAHDAYAKTAPATVLIRAKGSMGTGVIVDPSGIVLTNYHVVDSGKQPDFTFKVSVELGKMMGSGRMVRQEKVYEGVVIKADPLRDVALVKLEGAPANLPHLKLAGRDPQIGEPVLSVGHASIGFLWAAKGCQVANVGESNRDISLLAGIDCKAQRDQVSDPAIADKVEKNCENQKAQLKDILGSKNQGLLVQTDCAITHGDSGGPLVTPDGDIVGINQSIRTDRATTSFHVHVAELRDFMKDIPKKPAQVIPDIFCDGGLQQSLEDADLDGKPDVLYMKGFDADGRLERVGYLLDLDENTFTRPDHDGRLPFDSEVGLLNLNEGTFVFYDTDDDGRFDVLLVDHKGTGKPDKQYRIEKDGSVTADESIGAEHDFDVKLIKPEHKKARFGRIASVIRPASFTSEAALAAASKVVVPDALWGGGRAGRALDTDRDGKPDMVSVSSAFSKGLLFDTDEDSLSSLKHGEDAKALLDDRKVDAELSIVQQGTTSWALYDTNNDGKFDLALLSPGGDDWRLALGAWTIGDGGALTPAPEHVGRKLVRPGLLQGGERAAKGLELASVHYAKDEGMGSVPNPMRKEATYSLREFAGIPNAVVEVRSQGTYSLIIDADRDSMLTKTSKIGEMIEHGKLKADFAIVNHAGKEWVYYDTDGDNKFDLVLFSAHPGTGMSEAAFRLVGGKLEYDAALARGKLIRTKNMFKKPTLAAPFKKLVDVVFKKVAVED